MQNEQRNQRLMMANNPMANAQSLLTAAQGLLSVVGDPVGQVLDKTLKPTVGHITGAIGGPPGEAAERVQKVTKNAYKWEGNKENDILPPKAPSSSGPKRKASSTQLKGTPIIKKSKPGAVQRQSTSEEDEDEDDDEDDG